MRITRRNLKSASRTALAISCVIPFTRTAIADPTFANASFETPNVISDPDSFQYDPTLAQQGGSGWTFTGNSGIVADGGFDGTGISGMYNAPDGNQAALLQAVSNFTQIVSGFSAGPFTLSLYAEGRNYLSGANPLQISIDGTTLNFNGSSTITPPTGNHFTFYTSTPFIVSTGSHTLKIAGTDAGLGDVTSFVDAISFEQAPLFWNNAGAPLPSDGRTWDNGTNFNWNTGAASAVYTNGTPVVFNDSNNATANGGTNPNAYSVTLNTTVEPAGIMVDNSNGNYSISGSGKIAGNASLTKSGTGTLTLSTANTYTGGTYLDAGVLEINPTSSTTSALPAGPVSIIAGTLQLAPNVTLGSQTTATPASNVHITSLSISGTGTFDINNNHIIVNYTAGNDPIATIATYLSTGYNGGAWNGPGIISSAAQTNSSYSLGYADAADPGNPAGLASGQIEVKYTLYGDLNLDGIVNGNDFAILAANFGKTVTGGWDEGDLNFDKLVNGADFALLAKNFGKSATGAALTLPASDWSALYTFAAAHGLLADVPEPTPAVAVTLSTLATLRRRHLRTL
jgi:autotransporter-associated beta strand protein